MSEYLLIILSVLSCAFLASFEKNIRFIQYFISALASIILTGSAYIAWDIWAVYRGYWSFNPVHVSEFRFLGLPGEALLFFLAIPYSGLLIWSAFQFFRRNIPDEINFVSLRSGVLLCGVAFIMWFGKGYDFTAFVFGASGLFFLADHFLKMEITKSASFWYTQAVLALIFLFLELFLTSKPVLLFNTQYQLGLYVFTVPFEMFLYGFSLNAWVMLVFKALKSKI